MPCRITETDRNDRRPIVWNLARGGGRGYVKPEWCRHIKVGDRVEVLKNPDHQYTSVHAGAKGKLTQLPDNDQQITMLGDDSSQYYPHIKDVRLVTD